MIVGVVVFVFDIVTVVGVLWGVVLVGLNLCVGSARLSPIL